MREKLNGNPLAQVALIGILGVGVVFLLLTRLQSASENPAPAETAAPTATGAAVAPTATPAPSGSAVPTTPVPESEPPASDFVAGPGLPAKIVKAHERGATVMLIVTRSRGIEDAMLRRLSTRLGAEADVALFHTLAKNVADYSRIAQGVDLSRVPAVVAVVPRDIDSQGPPAAIISYGFRGYESLRQMARDVAYDGKKLPYHPK